jgi:predicted metal-dependent HD superfamily phosphohydrolase
MEVESELLQKSQKYVETFLKENLSEGIYYHDLEHTQEVVNASQEIGIASDLSEDELETVLIAAWFHDTGYYKGMKDHETLSKDVAVEFLKNEGVDENKITDVAGCILATEVPQHPKNIMEEVLCDADLYHVSTKEFFMKSELLRKEFSLIFPDEIQLDDWFKNSIKFLKNHTFFTDYAREKLMPAKNENLKKLKVLYKDIQFDDTDEEKTGKPGKSKKKKQADNRPTRGIETLFRVTSRNHVDFSSMADNKANIMISINAIMMSIVFSVLFNKFATDPNLIPPTIILTLVSTSTIIFAILATRPNLSAGVFTKDDIKKRKTNLLFFGNFYKMPLGDYEWGMKELMNDKDFLYGSLIRDIYYLGKVLGKKYLYLRISYTIFMYGLVLSIISFAVAVIFFPTTRI